MEELLKEVKKIYPEAELKIEDKKTDAIVFAKIDDCIYNIYKHIELFKSFDGYYLVGVEKQCNEITETNVACASITSYIRYLIAKPKDKNKILAVLKAIKDTEKGNDDE